MSKAIMKLKRMMMVLNLLDTITASKLDVLLFAYLILEHLEIFDSYNFVVFAVFLFMRKHKQNPRRM